MGQVEGLKPNLRGALQVRRSVAARAWSISRRLMRTSRRALPSTAHSDVASKPFFWRNMLRSLISSMGRWSCRSRSGSDADPPPGSFLGSSTNSDTLQTMLNWLLRIGQTGWTARSRPTFSTLQNAASAELASLGSPLVRLLGEALVPLAQLSTHRCGISLILGARLRPAADISCGVRYGRRILCWLFQPDRPDRPSCNRTRLAAALIDCPTCDGVRRLPRPLWLGLRLSAVLEAPTRIPQGGIGPLLVPAAASYHLHCRRC